jgi:hypothetical protein
VQVKAEDAGGETFFNNILGSSSSTYGSIGTSSSSSGLVSDYNVVLDSFSTTLGSSKLTLAQWRSATGQDQHSVIASPSQLFVNPSANDYHLKAGSPAIDRGVGSLNGRSAPTADFANTPRPQGASWDAGAYEYPGTTANPDTTPPAISNVAASNLTATGASVAWTTDEASDTQVEYGTSTAYGTSTTLNATGVTSHVANLSGLSASTLYHYRVKSRDAAGNLATSGDFTFTTAAAPDTTPPTVVDSNFAFAAMPQSVSFKFSEDVSAGMNGSELSVVNLDTGAQVPASDLTFTYGSGNVATWSYVPGTLPDGDYRATLDGSKVHDAAGNKLGADATLDFFALAGDTNRDRVVDFNDLVNVAQNYNTDTGMTYAEGDLNMDHAVDFNDLVILAQNYNSSLPAPATVAAQPAVLSAATAANTAPQANASGTTTPVFSTTWIKAHKRPQPRHRPHWTSH